MSSRAELRPLGSEAPDLVAAVNGGKPDCPRYREFIAVATSEVHGIEWCNAL